MRCCHVSNFVCSVHASHLCTRASFPCVIDRIRCDTSFCLCHRQNTLRYVVLFVSSTEHAVIRRFIFYVASVMRTAQGRHNGAFVCLYIHCCSSHTLTYMHTLPIHTSIHALTYTHTLPIHQSTLAVCRNCTVAASYPSSLVYLQDILQDTPPVPYVAPDH